MAERKPTEGAPVLHHGRLHQIKAIQPRAVMKGDKATKVDMVVFENEGFLVTGLASDFQWSDKLGAWYMPGRVLSRNERAVLEAVTGSWPPAENHVAALGMLDAVDLAEIDIKKVASVIERRKADAKAAVQAGETTFEDYAQAALEQVAALRAARQGG